MGYLILTLFTSLMTLKSYTTDGTFVVQLKNSHHVRQLVEVLERVFQLQEVQAEGLVLQDDQVPPGRRDRLEKDKLRSD